MSYKGEGVGIGGMTTLFVYLDRAWEMRYADPTNDTTAIEVERSLRYIQGYDRIKHVYADTYRYIYISRT